MRLILQFLGLPQRRSITRYRVLAKKDHLVINQTVTEKYANRTGSWPRISFWADSSLVSCARERFLRFEDRRAAEQGYQGGSQGERPKSLSTRQGGCVQAGEYTRNAYSHTSCEPDQCSQDNHLPQGAGLAEQK